MEGNEEFCPKAKKLSSFLDEIPEESLSVYPQISAAKKKKQFANIIPIFQYDRPDYIITFAENPILVIEMTEHAYTGDNGLQRFGRVASAAENGVAFIYFGPLARVRDDELDLTDDPSSLSKRNLTSDFFEGMEVLHQLFGVPQLFSEWQTSTNGKVFKIPIQAPDEIFSKVYGHLIRQVESIIKQYINNLDPLRPQPSDFIISEQNKLKALATDTNTKFSDVKKIVNKKRTFELINNPKDILNNELNQDYFFKGKPDKLLALFALKRSSIDNLFLHDEIITNKSKIKINIDRLNSLQLFEKGSFIYFSGYKWRSDPHCGVAINLYYRMCKAKGLPLLLFYPRISISKDKTYEILQEINNTDNLIDLFKQRYPDEYKNKYQETINSKLLFHHWVTTTKQARIFHNYCSLIFCNDGIVIGKSLESLI